MEKKYPIQVFVLCFIFLGVFCGRLNGDGQLPSVSMSIPSVAIQRNHANSSPGKSSIETGIVIPQNKPPHVKKPSEDFPMYYRVVPACALVLIFVSGSFSIFVWERRKEKKKKMEDLDAIDDERLNNEWIEQLRNRKRRKSVFDRVRKMSFHSSSTVMKEKVDTEKEKKYKIYDEMLDKYWDTLRALRKGTRSAPAQKQDTENPAARLKQLAELHALSHGKGEKIPDADPSLPVVDQYTQILQSLKQDDVPKEQEFKENTPDEANDVNPASLHQKRRSSRFHKQAVVVIDDDTAATRPSLRNSAYLSESYLASQEDVSKSRTASMDEGGIPTRSASSNQLESDEELLTVLENITPREMSAIQRLQIKMRPKSLIESLAARHRESVRIDNAHATSMVAIHTADQLHSDEAIRDKGPSTGMTQLGINDDQQQLLGNVELRGKGKQRMRNRPKSLYDTGAVRRKINSGQRTRSRPASMYIPHIPQTIEEDKPSVQVIDIDSLQNLKYSSMTALEEDKVIADLEQQMIADVCEDNELSKEEIAALESLLEDVVSYSRENPVEPKRKLTKQYSLLSVKSTTSSVGGRRADLTSQLSFADSVSLFGDIEESQEEDQNEEAVLLSLAGTSYEKHKNRASLSKYDNM